MAQGLPAGEGWWEMIEKLVGLMLNWKLCDDCTVCYIQKRVVYPEGIQLLLYTCEYDLFSGRGLDSDGHHPYQIQFLCDTDHETCETCKVF